MSALAGSNERRFVDIYTDQVDEIQRKLFEYIKLLRPSSTNQPISSAVPRARPDLEITTKEGYPWMPPVVDDIEQKKDELEKILRQYLNTHYSE